MLLAMTDKGSLVQDKMSTVTARFVVNLEWPFSLDVFPALTFYSCEVFCQAEAKLNNEVKTGGT